MNFTAHILKVKFLKLLFNIDLFRTKYTVTEAGILGHRLYLNNYYDEITRLNRILEQVKWFYFYSKSILETYMKLHSAS